MANTGDIGSSWDRNQDDFQVANFSNDNNRSNNQILNKKETLIEFISNVQRMSVLESQSDDDFAEDLFTLKESLHGFSHGLKLGIYVNIFMLIHLLIAFLFCFKGITNSFDSKAVQNFLYYMPTVFIIISTIYISTLSKLAVGAYTNKAIVTFFLGKFLGALIIGIMVLVSTSYLFSLASIELNNLLTLNFNYMGFSSQDIYNAIINFLDKKNIIYFELSILLLVSTTLPFMIYGLRKYFFTINNQQAYEEY